MTVADEHSDGRDGALIWHKVVLVPSVGRMLGCDPSKVNARCCKGADPVESTASPLAIPVFHGTMVGVKFEMQFTCSRQGRGGFLSEGWNRSRRQGFVPFAARLPSPKHSGQADRKSGATGKGPQLGRHRLRSSPPRRTQGEYTETNF